VPLKLLQLVLLEALEAVLQVTAHPTLEVLEILLQPVLLLKDLLVEINTLEAVDVVEEAEVLLKSERIILSLMLFLQQQLPQVVMD
jgi:hypothetical protein